MCVQQALWKVISFPSTYKGPKAQWFAQVFLSGMGKKGCEHGERISLLRTSLFDLGQWPLGRDILVWASARETVRLGSGKLALKSWPRLRAIIEWFHIKILPRAFFSFLFFFSYYFEWYLGIFQAPWALCLVIIIIRLSPKASYVSPFRRSQSPLQGLISKIASPAWSWK